MYEKHGGIATIYFASFEYIFDDGDRSVRMQDRAILEFIYVIDIEEVDHYKRSFALSCPNCGTPIKNLGDKTCSYCKSQIIDIIKKIWICNDLKLY